MCCFDRPVRVGRLPTIDEALGPANVECPRCEGWGWVCESHPELPWEAGTVRDCKCGAPGMPCSCRPGTERERLRGLERSGLL